MCLARGKSAHKDVEPRANRSSSGRDGSAGLRCELECVGPDLNLFRAFGISISCGRLGVRGKSRTTLLMRLHSGLIGQTTPNRVR